MVHVRVWVCALFTDINLIKTIVYLDALREYPGVLVRFPGPGRNVFAFPVPAVGSVHQFGSGSLGKHNTK